MFTRFIGNVRFTLFALRTKYEIFQNIFVKILGLRNLNYPFSTYEELDELSQQGLSDFRQDLRAFECAVAKMGNAEGDAFRFIATRELRGKLAMYIRYAKVRQHSDYKQTQPAPAS